MLPLLTRRMQAEWSCLLPGHERPDKLGYLGFPGAVEGGTTTFLAFAETSEAPVFCVKVYRTSDGQKKAQNEAAVLRRLARCGERIAASVPRCLLCEEIGGVWYLVQSVLSGDIMRAPTAPGGGLALDAAKENMQLVSEWLVELNYVTRMPAGDCQGAGNLLCSELHAFREQFDLTRAEQDVLKRIVRGMPGLSSVPCVQHGDLCRQNVLLAQRGRIGVVDWSDNREEGTPLLDLLFFITTYSWQGRRSPGLASLVQTFADTFWDNSDYAATVWEVLGDHCRRIGVGIEALPLFLGAFLASRAESDHRKMVSSAARGYLPQFTLHLALAQDAQPADWAAQQPWVHLFRAYVEGLGALERKLGVLRL